MHCQACRRPLTNPASIRYGFGPDCLRKAVKAGTAPLEALTELAEWKRTKKQRTQAAQEQTVIRDTLTIDLFEQPRRDAISALRIAADMARSFGVRVSLEIEE
jgi:hypothetical protein